MKDRLIVKKEQYVQYPNIQYRTFQILVRIKSKHEDNFHSAMILSSKCLMKRLSEKVLQLKTWPTPHTPSLFMVTKDVLLLLVCSDNSYKLSVVFSHAPQEVSAVFSHAPQEASVVKDVSVVFVVFGHI
jgi:hypothetical protein